MAAETHIPAHLKLSQMSNSGAQVLFDTDVLVCLIVEAGPSIPDTSKMGIQFIADVTSTNPELAYAGYTRKTLTGQSITFDSLGAAKVNFTFAAVTFAHNVADPGTGRYIIIADTSLGSSDSDHPVVAVCDPNGFVSCAAADLVIGAPVPGLIQWV